MKLVSPSALVLACLLSWVNVPDSAMAQSMAPCGVSGFAYPGWFGHWGSPYSLGQIPVPPYFSLHPPVYYSQPVARSYGYSPYAYPGDMQTPEVVMPEMIENPHVESNKPAKLQEAKTAQYQLIENPYVRHELRSNTSTQLATMNRQEDRP